MKRLVAFTVVLGFAWISKAYADVPLVLNFNGKLETQEGPYEGDAELTFSIYTSESGGTPLWSETQTLSVFGGRFYTLLGLYNPLPEGIFSAEVLYLGISVGGNELSPRLRIASVPYALYAHNASLLEGQGASAFAPAAHNHDSIYVKRNEQGAVDSWMIVNGSILFEDLADNGCIEGQVIKRGPSGWICGQDKDTTYTAGSGLTLEGTQFSANVSAIKAWAQEACYDNPTELQTALSGWDQDASDDLTIATDFAGDVSGKYNALLLKQGAVKATHLDPGLKFASVRSDSPIPGNSFDLTPSNTTLVFGGGEGIDVSVDANAHKVVYSPNTGVLQKRISGECSGPGSFIKKVDAFGGVTCGLDALSALSCPAGGGVALNNGSAWECTRPLAVAFGGTGNTSAPKGGVAYGDGNKIVFTQAGANGQFLRVNAQSVPEWANLTVQDIPGGSPNYIQNQQSQAQSADFRISGFGLVGSELWIGPNPQSRLRLHNTAWSGDPPPTLPSYGLVEFVAGTEPPMMFVGIRSDNGPATGGLHLTGPEWVEVDTGGTVAAPAATFYAPVNFEDPGRPGTQDIAVSVAHGFHKFGDSSSEQIRGAAIGGGGSRSLPNLVTGHFGFVGGGAGNRAGPDASASLDTGRFTVVGGGYLNIASGDISTVSGGSNNVAHGDYSCICGGVGSTASDMFSSVVGGYANQAAQPYATVAGGGINRAHGYASSVGGGYGNEATLQFATVAGGGINRAYGSASSVGGGYANEAWGNYSVIPGGNANYTASDALYSFAAGRNARADARGCFVWADSTQDQFGNGIDFSCDKPDAFMIRAAGGFTVVTKKDGQWYKCTLVPSTIAPGWQCSTIQNP